MHLFMDNLVEILKKRPFKKNLLGFFYSETLEFSKNIKSN